MLKYSTGYTLKKQKEVLFMKRKVNSTLSLLLILLMLVSCTQTPPSDTGAGESTAKVTDSLSVDTEKESEPEASEQTTPDSTPESSDDETTGTTDPDKKPIDISELSFGDLTDAELEAFYQKAVTARSKFEYQYAYGLFAMLARRGYKDSAEQERSLILYGNAIKIIETEARHVVGGKNCSDNNVPLDAKGFLYISEGGIPKFTCQKDGVKYDIVPDTTLRDVVSITAHTYYNMVGHPNVYQCIRSDGTVGVIVNALSSPAGMQTDDLQKAIDDYTSYIASLKDVVKISTTENGYESVYLHSDGTLSYYTSSDSAQTKEKKDRVEAWTDIVDIGYSITMNITAIKGDGTYLYEKMYRDLSDDTVNEHFGKDDKIQLLGRTPILDGIVKSMPVSAPGEYSYNGEYFPYKKIVYSGNYFCLDADGNVLTDYTTFLSMTKVDGIAYVQYLQSSVASIGCDGKIRISQEDKADKGYIEDLTVEI